VGRHSLLTPIHERELTIPIAVVSHQLPSPASLDDTAVRSDALDACQLTDPETGVGRSDNHSRVIHTAVEVERGA